MVFLCALYVFHIWFQSGFYSVNWGLNFVLLCVVEICWNLRFFIPVISLNFFGSTFGLLLLVDEFVDTWTIFSVSAHGWFNNHFYFISALALYRCTVPWVSHKIGRSLLLNHICIFSLFAYWMLILTNLLYDSFKQYQGPRKEIQEWGRALFNYHFQGLSIWLFN